MGAKNTITGVWIDKNINSEENKKYRTKLSSIIGLEIRPYDNVSIALEYLKKLDFIPIFIICSGRLYPEFITNFKKNINIFKICPKIIIFTSNKQKFYEFNKKFDLVNNSFFNSGVFDTFNDLKEFILFTHQELYQFKDIFPLLYEKILNILSQKEEKKVDESIEENHEQKDIQLNFEYVPNRNYLILPLFMSDITKNPTEEDINEFNHYLIDKYTVKEIIKLISQLIRKKNIPIEIISKFWVRAYTVECNFYRDMNKDLRENKISKYLPFIQMMYNAVSVNSFSFNPSDSKLYRGTYFSEEELEKLRNYIKNKKEGLPAAIIYSRSFFSFSLDPSIAKKFEKNVTLIINNFHSTVKGCAAISEFSIFKNESEILVFPLSCFEIKELVNRGENKYYINLDYLGQYEKLFEGEDLKELVKLIPKDSLLSNQVLSSKILEETYQAEIKNDFIILKYKISPNVNKVRIFGENFVNNHTFWKYSYEGKYYKLSEYFNIKDLKVNSNELEIKLINVSILTDISYMFNDCKSLISIDNMNNKITALHMNNMFNNCSSLISINGDLDIDTRLIKNMKNLFQGCSSLKCLPDISKWNTEEVHEMGNMFKDCSSLISLPDISKWVTSKVTNMGNIFSGCISLSSLPDISLWNTHKVYDMGNMFKDCSSLTSLPDISKWDTSNVQNMGNIFSGCSSLSSLPNISLWNMEKSTDISQMFCKCKSLTSLPDISKWNINNISKINKYYMFLGCNKSLTIPKEYK